MAAGIPTHSENVGGQWAPSGVRDGDVGWIITTFLPIRTGTGRAAAAPARVAEPVRPERIS